MPKLSNFFSDAGYHIKDQSFFRRLGAVIGFVVLMFLTHKGLNLASTNVSPEDPSWMIVTTIRLGFVRLAMATALILGGVALLVVIYNWLTNTKTGAILMHKGVGPGSEDSNHRNQGTVFLSIAMIVAAAIFAVVK